MLGRLVVGTQAPWLAFVSLCYLGRCVVWEAAVLGDATDELVQYYVILSGARAFLMSVLFWCQHFSCA